jgi:hypothetical protein
VQMPNMGIFSLFNSTMFHFQRIRFILLRHFKAISCLYIYIYKSLLYKIITTWFLLIYFCFVQETDLIKTLNQWCDYIQTLWLWSQAMNPSFTICVGNSSFTIPKSQKQNCSCLGCNLLLISRPRTPSFYNLCWWVVFRNMVIVIF